MTRQNMRKLVISHSTNFPIPVHEGSTAVWHLADVLTWLQAKGTYKLERAMVKVAKTAKQINLAKEAGQLAPEMQRTFQTLVA